MRSAAIGERVSKPVMGPKLIQFHSLHVPIRADVWTRPVLIPHAHILMVDSHLYIPIKFHDNIRLRGVLLSP